MSILPAKYARIRWDAEHAQPWIHQCFTWTDRESYLAWVAQWKVEIHEKIKDVREQKVLRRDTTEDQAAAQSKRHYLRIECANMYLIRQMAKQLACQQREERLRALAA